MTVCDCVTVCVCVCVCVCQIADLVLDGYLESRVMFDSAHVPSVEIVLSQTPFQVYSQRLMIHTCSLSLSG